MSTSKEKVTIWDISIHIFIILIRSNIYMDITVSNIRINSPYHHPDIGIAIYNL
jgi:hypothetical protein